jgi:hypothetical protein
MPAPVVSAPSSSGLGPQVAPRGGAPAAARRQAVDLFARKEFSAAAEAWSTWARTVPSGSWTVQIAAVRLDRASSTGALKNLTGRDDLFLLPPGALPGGLSPVCVGVYDSEASARRAAAAMSDASGGRERPIVKPLRSLNPGG